MWKNFLILLAFWAEAKQVLDPAAEITSLSLIDEIFNQEPQNPMKLIVPLKQSMPLND